MTTANTAANLPRNSLGRLAIVTATALATQRTRADIVTDRFPNLGEAQRTLLTTPGPKAAAVESIDLPPSTGAGQLYVAVSQGTLLGRTPVLATVKLNSAFGAFPGTEPTGVIKVPGQPILLQRFDFSAVTVPAIRAVAEVAFSRELIEDSNAEGGIRDLMTRAVHKAADTELVRLALDGASATASGADSTFQLRAQVRAMVSALVAAGANAGQIVLAASPSTLVLLATASDMLGNASFPSITVTGGSLCGLPLLASFGVDDGAIVAIAGDAILRAAGSIEVMAAKSAMLEFADNPTGAAEPGETPVAQSRKRVSLWQANCVALNVWFTFGVGFVRDDRAAFIDGITLEGATS